VIKGEVLGGEAVVGHLKVGDERLRTGLTQSIGRLILTLQRNVKQNKLSGQVLNVRTGRLRRSINSRMEQPNTAHPAGVVGTNVSYARAWEYGFNGTVNVRESLRMQVTAFGKSIEPQQVTVKAHSRKVNMPAKSFLGSALQELQPEIMRELSGSVTEAIR
jgi:phage gpG-like protein